MTATSVRFLLLENSRKLAQKITKVKKIVFPPVHKNTDNGTRCERARCAAGGRSRDALRYRPQVSSVFPHNSRRIAYFLELIALGNHKLRFGCGHQLTISSSIPPRDIGVSTYDTLLATFRCNTSLVRWLSASLDAHFDVLPGIGAYN